MILKTNFLTVFCHFMQRLSLLTFYWGISIANDWIRYAVKIVSLHVYESQSTGQTRVDLPGKLGSISQGGWSGFIEAICIIAKVFGIGGSRTISQPELRVNNVSRVNSRLIFRLSNLIPDQFFCTLSFFFHLYNSMTCMTLSS